MLLVKRCHGNIMCNILTLENQTSPTIKQILWYGKIMYCPFPFFHTKI